VPVDITSRAAETQERAMLIDGSASTAQSGRTYVTRSPALGVDLSLVPDASSVDVDRAVSAAADAYVRWEAETAFQRARWCHQIADALGRAAERIALEVTLEQGKPIAEARDEVSLAVECFRLAAEEGKRLTGQTLPVQDPRKRVFTVRRPRGVYAAITPFNFPVSIAADCLANALAVGNAVVWKPAPTTASVAALVAACVAETDLPPGLLNLVTGTSTEMSQRLVTHPLVVGVVFVGSPSTGRAIARAAGGKHLLLELGGNGPVIVLEDANISKSVDAIAISAFMNAGQACSAAERILCDVAVYDELVEQLTRRAQALRLGEPWLDTTQIGPVHNQVIVDRMDAHIADAVAKGASVTAGGDSLRGQLTPYFYEPTVLRDVPSDAAVHREETFGPIAPITPIASDAEAIRLANSCQLGLSSAVFAGDIGRALRLAERIHTGQVIINDTSNYAESHLPFGGWPGKESGIGRLGGATATAAFSEIQTISIDLEAER
jgi:acyl-CoA reductase-like NAD-dependent aldehyde dehydrogenase